jgi:hypothetical protein
MLALFNFDGVSSPDISSMVNGSLVVPGFSGATRVVSGLSVNSVAVIVGVLESTSSQRIVESSLLPFPEHIEFEAESESSLGSLTSSQIYGIFVPNKLALHSVCSAYISRSSKLRECGHAASCGDGSISSID